MRVELIHPAIVHFPLALLLVGAGLRTFSFFVRRTSLYSYLLFGSRLVLVTGACFAWAAVLAGEVASDRVVNALCQPKVLEKHSILAYAASLFFSAGVILDCSRTWKKLRPYKKTITLCSSFFIFVATLALVSAGFFGGSLVYDQGAAVQKQCF